MFKPEKHVSFIGRAQPSDGGYSPAFVEEIKRAAKLPPEATFNNATEMLAWLNKPSDGGVTGPDQSALHDTRNPNVLREMRGWGASQDPSDGGVAGEPVAWSCELAYSLDNNRVYGDWRPWLGRIKPNVPEGSIRNLQALYALPPVPGNEGREADISRASFWSPTNDIA